MVVTTWTGGSPGYGQLAATNVNHCKVSTWRGYSAVQQDGIWTKQGIVVPIVAADVTNGGTGVATPSQILYEGNAQILSGTVYKMWFCSQQPGNGGTNPGNISYAESVDGVNWTRYTGAAGGVVLSGYVGPSLIKNGSTYYLYVQPATAPGTGTWALYTSTDGINWSQVSTTVLA